MIESGRNWRRKKFLSQNKNVPNQVRCFGEIMTIKVKRIKQEPKYCFDRKRKRNQNIKENKSLYFSSFQKGSFNLAEMVRAGISYT